MLEQRLGSTARAAVTVLVVEDDDDMRELLVETLERDGYVVLSAGSIGDALLTIQRVKGRVDLVLTDVRMSTGMASGIDFGHVLRRSGAPRATPLILMTAFPDSAVYEAATSMNATVLSKPFRLDVLRREVLTRIAEHVKHLD